MRVAALVAVTIATACVAPAVGPGVRADLSARVVSAQPAITQCYANALKARQNLRGIVVLAFAAAPTTGQFVDIIVTRDDLRDPGLDRCVVGAIAQLRLAQPLTTRVAVPGLPIRFTPQ
jgi:hypothetical protein